MAARSCNIIIFLLLASCSLTSFSQLRKPILPAKGFLKITFENTVNRVPLALNDSIYTNSTGERYSISKLRYYVSNVLITGNKTFRETNSYHLIDEAKHGSKQFILALGSGRYTGLTFMLGVDSLHNVTGAQTDALDPMNDMFWTWNTGYVMAKMEGHSEASNLGNHLFEFHIGGFSGINKVLKNIILSFPMNEPIDILPGYLIEIIIKADINSWWNGVKDISLATTPSISSPGAMAKLISDNYAKMFVIQQVSAPIHPGKRLQRLNNSFTRTHQVKSLR